MITKKELYYLIMQRYDALEQQRAERSTSTVESPQHSTHAHKLHLSSPPSIGCCELDPAPLADHPAQSLSEWQATIQC